MIFALLIAFLSVASSSVVRPAPTFAPACAVRRAATCAITMQAPSPKEATGLEKFVGGLLQVAEDASKAASEAADDWVNAGWQVKKRAGQVIPEVRPTTQNLEAKVTKYVAKGRGARAAAPRGS